MSPSPATAALLARLSGVKRCGYAWKALCPVHSERTPSLSVKDGDTGVPLVRCFGCGARYADVVAVLGIDGADLSRSGLRRSDLPPPARCAEPETLDRVYRALLAAPELGLQPAHAEQLRRRSLPDDEIRWRGYRSLPIRGRAKLARELGERFSVETMATVPGWCGAGAEGHEDYPTWHGPAGLVVPVRDTAGLIIALKVRVDDPEASAGKYLLVSSTKHGGPTPGCPVHVPLFTGSRAEIRCTEGELKADIVTFLSGQLTIGLSGVNARAGLLSTLEALR